MFCESGHPFWTCSTDVVAAACIVIAAEVVVVVVCKRADAGLKSSAPNAAPTVICATCLSLGQNNVQDDDDDDDDGVVGSFI